LPIATKSKEKLGVDLLGRFFRQLIYKLERKLL